MLQKSFFGLFSTLSAGIGFREHVTRERAREIKHHIELLKEYQIDSSHLHDRCPVEPTGRQKTLKVGRIIAETRSSNFVLGTKTILIGKLSQQSFFGRQVIQKYREFYRTSTVVRETSILLGRFAAKQKAIR